jgi:uncharacterized protein (TIGR02444 family)
MSAGKNVESFWDFSVRTYRTPGVPDACLSLQNDYGADVNMLLYCCWVGAHVGQFERELFESASRFSAAWANHVVVPLRSARTWMKHEGCSAEPVPMDSCMALREKIKSVEFDAEKLQQDTLDSLTTSERSGNYSTEQILQAVNANLDRYFVHAGIESCDDTGTKLRVIINAGLGIGVPFS